MSIRLTLDDSLIQVAPTLDDIEAVLIVQTCRMGTEADGTVRKLTNAKGRRRTVLPRIDSPVGRGVVETRIGVNDAKGQPEYETKTLCRAGGAGNVFLQTTRRVRFALRWYGDNRFMELRVQVFPGAEIVANRGLSPLGAEGGFNFIGTLQSDHWAEIHYDNHTHVGSSMTVHSDRNFSKWAEIRPTTPPSVRTRFDRLDDPE